MKACILAGAMAVVLVATASPALAQSEKAFSEDLVISSESFLAAHPDLNNRHRGMRAYEAGRYQEAMSYFRRAARYADKASQAMVAEMLWKGEGSARDPALAYAWMDLASERGYPGFTVLRERYWARLDERQREEAVARGEAVYAEFGDAAAKPRIASVLRRERRRTTGSRLGFVGFLQVMVPGPGGWESIDGTHFYDKKFWDPELYQAWHDAVWMEPNEGRVSIGDVEPMRRDTPDGGD